jgi:hypothetical protein
VQTGVVLVLIRLVDLSGSSGTVWAPNHLGNALDIRSKKFLGSPLRLCHSIETNENAWCETYLEVRFSDQSTGDGFRYASKILSKHADTWVVPIVLYDVTESDRAPDLDKRKQRLREEILRAFQFPADTIPSDTIRTLLSSNGT